MKTIAFYTLGCKANQYQTEVIKSQLAGDDSLLLPFGEKADLYVINTCTVTQDADRKSRQAIRKALRLGKKVVVTGCYSRLQGEELKQLFPEIVLTPLIPLSIGDGEGENLPTGRQARREGVRIRANLMVQDGCRHFCSYCIVPYARGDLASKPVEEAITEAKRLVSKGAREIILTGINLGAYQFDLPELIRRLAQIDGLKRIRISSIEPMYLEKEIIDAMADTQKVCRHLHIPLQSGDNNILKAMNRHYTRDDYLKLVDYIRDKIPDCGITTDIITGFPGESEKQFRNTVDLINQIKFSRLHIFPYSIRKGTPAAEFPNQVDISTMKQRSRALHKLREKYMAEFANQYLGKEVEILVEQKGEGLTSNYIRVLFPGNQSEVGSLKKITIKEIKAEHCLAL
jgi:threonylcarbamoyladenosine tRNA methylthiotransferase MtaB